MRISRQFRRVSRVLPSKSDFLSFLRNRPPTREFSFLYSAHPAKLPSCTTILVAESQDLKPQMQTVLSSRAVIATSILTAFAEISLAGTPKLSGRSDKVRFWEQVSKAGDRENVCLKKTPPGETGHPPFRLLLFSLPLTRCVLNPFQCSLVRRLSIIKKTCSTV